MANAQRENTPFRVKRQFARTALIARHPIRKKPFGAVRDPFDGPAKSPRRPTDQGIFIIEVDLATEATAHIGGENPEAFTIHLEDMIGEIFLGAIRCLGAGMESPATRCVIIIRDGGARFHEALSDAGLFDREARNMRCRIKSRLYRCCIAKAPVKHTVSGHMLLQRWCARCKRIGGLSDMGQDFPLYGDEFRRITGLLQAIGDDERYLMANIHGTRAGKRQIGHLDEFAAIAIFWIGRRRST